MDLHVPSLFLFSAQITLVLAASMLWVSRGNLSGGLKACGLGLFSFAVGLCFLGLRGIIAEPASLLMGHGLISLSLGSLLAALYRFQQREIRYELAAGPVLLVTIALSLQLDDHRGQTLTTSLVYAFQTAAIAVTTLGDRRFRDGRGRELVVLATALESVLMLTRAALILTGSYTPSLADDTDNIKIMSFSSSLTAMVVFTIGFFTMINERAEARNQELASRDDLTGVPNRRELLRELKSRIKEARRLQSPLSILMLDIDHFKQINDAHGHLAGDAVLKHLTQELDRRLRGHDTLGRYGGEEFVVILPHTTPDDGKRVAEDLLDHIRAMAAPYGRKTIRIRASIGVYGGLPGPEESRTDFIRRADEALYRAKQTGRDRAVLAG